MRRMPLLATLTVFAAVPRRRVILETRLMHSRPKADIERIMTCSGSACLQQTLTAQCSASVHGKSTMRTKLTSAAAAPMAASVI